MAYKCPKTLENKGFSGTYAIWKIRCNTFETRKVRSVKRNGCKSLLRKAIFDMFETPQKKTELMIVCDDKTMLYAKYLVQLISKTDDEENMPIGTKDGAVSAAIYTEAQYKDTLAKVTSNTHILFIGDNKTTQAEAKFIDYKINCFGMKYGWNGKRAVMFVDGKIEEKDWELFVEYTNRYHGECDQEDKKRKNAGARIASWVLLPGVSLVYDKIKEKEKTKEQQYRCLTLAMYMDGLQSFLEE